MKKIFSFFIAVILLVSCLCSLNANAAINLNKYQVTTYEAPCYFSVEAMEQVGTIWQYEYSTNYNLDFKPMEKKLGLYVSSKDGNQFEYAEFTSPWNTDTYLLPGHVATTSTSVNAIQTFIAPSNGYATIRACDVKRHYGLTDSGDVALQDCEIAIFLNNKLIWPTNGKWQKITAAKSATQPKDNIVSVPELTELQVKKGDKIRFAVGCGTLTHSNWNDYVAWYSVVDFYTPSQSTPNTSTSIPSTPSTDVTPSTGIDVSDSTNSDVSDSTNSDVSDSTNSDVSDSIDSDASDAIDSDVSDSAESNVDDVDNKDKQKNPIVTVIIILVALALIIVVLVYLILKKKIVISKIFKK